jgi:Cytochrome P450
MSKQLLVHCLFEISVRKEYIDPLRKEVENAFHKYGGWTKSAIESMNKLDSFIKECQRFNPLDAGMLMPNIHITNYLLTTREASLARETTTDFCFTNGLKLPKGTKVFAPNGPMLFDDNLYDNAKDFDGFRFWRLAEQTQKPHDYRFVSTSWKYLQFGDGRHTWCVL